LSRPKLSTRPSGSRLSETAILTQGKVLDHWPTVADIGETAWEV
jgi:hypothetical protein